MRKKLYIIVPIVVGVLIIHALFGHLIFGFPYEQDINKYSTYVHLQPEWNSYPKNILYDVTTVWSNPSPSGNNPFYEEGIGARLKTEYNPNELQYINAKSYVEVNHEFSDCKNGWEPIAYRHAIDVISHQWDNLVGVQLNSDPYVIVYSLLQNPTYIDAEQITKTKSGFSMFVPICTAKESTTYDYSVKINDEKIGFDVYFVSSANERKNYFDNSDEFSYYDGCFGLNYNRFSGTCHNVDRSSGLLIVIPDELNLSLTEITVNLHEK